jgi:hypothetical protein
MCVLGAYDYAGLGGGSFLVAPPLARLRSISSSFASALIALASKHDVALVLATSQEPETLESRRGLRRGPLCVQAALKG